VVAVQVKADFLLELVVAGEGGHGTIIFQVLALRMGSAAFSACRLYGSVV
jgi:hypothetical protein